MAYDYNHTWASKYVTVYDPAETYIQFRVTFGSDMARTVKAFVSTSASAVLAAEFDDYSISGGKVGSGSFSTSTGGTIIVTGLTSGTLYYYQLQMNAGSENVYVYPGPGSYDTFVTPAPTTYYYYSITFNANGGSGAGSPRSASSTKTSYTFSALQSSEEPTRSGYKFLGWSTSSTASSPTYETGDTVTVYSSNPDITLYAVWQKTYTYYLYFDANGGTGGATQRYITTTATSYTFDPLAQSYVPLRSGYEFLGWADTSTATTAKYFVGSEITLYSSSPTKTIYAVWAKQYTYTLTFDAKGGTLGSTGRSSIGTTSCTFSSPLATYEPTRSNYSFLGWTTSSVDSSVEYYNSDSITLYYPNTDETLYAVWKAYIWYYLYFDANGGTGGGTSRSGSSPYAYYDFAQLTTAEVPTRDGYEFLGWSEDPSATTAEYSVGDTVRVYEDDPSVTLYAVWKQIVYTYTVYLDPNGGDGEVVEARKVITPNKTYTFTALQQSEVPTRQGYQFVGWATSTTGTPQYNVGSTITLTHPTLSITLFAIWSKYLPDDATLYETSDNGTSLTVHVDGITARDYERTVTITCGTQSSTLPLIANATQLSVRFTGLSSGTTYTTSVKISAPDGTVTHSQSGSGYTCFAFGWTNIIAAGYPASNLTYSDWNSYTELLEQKAERRGVDCPDFTSVNSGDTITSGVFNEAVTALYYDYDNTYKISKVSKGDVIYATIVNSLATYLNTDDN